MDLFKKKANKKEKKAKTMTLEKFRPIFTTVDGKEHVGRTFPWIDSGRLTCSPESFMMTSITRDKYIKDTEGVFYPLQNIVSIKWEKLDEKTVLDNFYHEYDIYFTNDEVKKMTKYTLD